MASTKISQLPTFSGDTDGVYIVMNNSGNTTTYKVDRETFLQNIATLGSNNFSGNQSINGLLDIPLTTKNYDDVGIPGQICWDTEYIYVCVGVNLWKRVELSVYGITPTPTTTPTNTPTNTPTVTPTVTPSITPTLTPTPSPVWLFVIQNSSPTRSVTDASINGVTQTLSVGSYPVLNGSAFATSHGINTGSTPLSFTFGGSGFFNTYQVYKNGVLTFDLPGYASGSMVCGGMNIASNDVIQLICS